MNDVALNLQDLCRVLQIGEASAYRLLKEGRLTAAKVGRRWRIDPEMLKAFLQRGDGGNGHGKAKRKSAA
jgi:excisionase family DNA binding protein